jgi:hypothetical protein
VIEMPLPIPAEVGMRWLRWVLDTQPASGRAGDRTGVTSVSIDPKTGQVVVVLDRHDPAYAAELEATGDGVIKVDPEPMVLHPLTAPR